MLKRQFREKEFWSVPNSFFSMGWYENRTNFKGSVFGHYSLKLGRIYCWAHYDWFKWPEYGGRERGFEVHWAFPIIGDFRFRFTFQHNSFKPDHTHSNDPS